MPNMFTLVLQIAVVLAVCRLVGNVFLKIQQPRVVGEMFAGIMLGPSLLGWLAPQFSTYLFPASSLGFLSALSQIGVIVFMFLVGLGINPKELKSHGHAAVLTSHVSITAPFVLASFLAIYLYPRLSDDSVPFTSFALFMGAAMSITAFPVLARILTERNLLQSRLGTVAIACAAVDDVTGWCILAYIVLLIRSKNTGNPIWLTVGGLIAFALIMIYGVQHLLRRFESTYRNRGQLSDNALALMILLALASALCTEWLGIHLLFGSFLMGAIMPKEQKLVRYVLDRFETIVVTLLLPLFFAFTGLRTNIGLVKGPEMWMYCGANHRRRNAGQTRRLHAGLVVDRNAGEGGCRPGHADEHPRPDGVGHPEYRSGYQGDLARAVLNDGPDGTDDYLHDQPGVAGNMPGQDAAHAGRARGRSA